jgi:hypothetical protein
MLSGKLKQHGQEIMKMLPGLLKDPSKIPNVELTSKDEHKSLQDNKKKLETEFGCEIIIEYADHSQEPKAKNSWPGKPALVVK